VPFEETHVKTVPNAIFSAVISVFVDTSSFCQAPPMMPTRELQAPSDQAPQDVRSARAAYFDRIASPPGLSFEARDPRMPPAIVFHNPAPKGELPQNLADTIIIGKIAGVQAYLSKNRGAIYTESTIAIEEVISSKQDLASVSSIVLLQDGGAIGLTNGSVFTQTVHGLRSELQQGGEYLFFLRSLKSLTGYGCSKAWSLTGGTVAAVSSDDLARAANHTSTYQGMSVSEFLPLVRALKASLIDQ
jgi:hypothetical protein